MLDGEIVLDVLEDGTDQLKFLVFDALIVDGKNLMQRNLSNRLGVLHFYIMLIGSTLWSWCLSHTRHMSNNIQWYSRMCLLCKDRCGLSNFRVEDKSMQFAYGIDMMFRDILPRLAHGNDGLIFTSLDGEYICGTDPHMYILDNSVTYNRLKWKPDDENSIDFRLNLIFPLASRKNPHDITTRKPFSDI